MPPSRAIESPFADHHSEEHFEELTKIVLQGDATVIIGAGFGRKAMPSLPGWRELHDALLERSSLPPREYDPARVLDTFDELRSDLDEEYLAVLREHLH